MTETKPKKIAIVGTAPSSVTLVPMFDPSWTIWACSPACAVVLPSQPGYRVDEWFEIHRWGPNEGWLTAHFREFLRAFPNKVWTNPDMTGMLVETGQVPNAVPYPADAVLAEFGPRWFTSSPAWMMAKAIMEKPAEIGLFGIDMAAQDEWNDQRPGMHVWIDRADSRGIRITVPPESDLLYPARMYGMSETDPVQVKWMARRNEIKTRLADATQREQQAAYEKAFLSGAYENMEYMRSYQWYYRNTHIPIDA